MLLVFCGYVTNDHKVGGFEQHKLIISPFARVRLYANGPGLPGPVLSVSRAKADPQLGCGLPGCSFTLTACRQRPVSGAA